MVTYRRRSFEEGTAKILDLHIFRVEATGERSLFPPLLSFLDVAQHYYPIISIVMSAIMGQSRRPRLYFFVVAFFLAVFLFSLVGFHDVGLLCLDGSFLLVGDCTCGLCLHRF